MDSKRTEETADILNRMVDYDDWSMNPRSLFYLVGRTLQHARVCRSYGTLIVPQWKLVPFWPLLCPSEDSFAHFVVIGYSYPS